MPKARRHDIHARFPSSAASCTAARLLLLTAAVLASRICQTVSVGLQGCLFMLLPPPLTTPTRLGES